MVKEKMFSLREMLNPQKTSKKASTAANKIKNKILNTSSFFKVSLQSNNKALAVALQAQRERSRQLEKDVVLMQKQVEELCFQLASRNYKHRRLLMILKNLQRDTMEQLSSATDLLTSSEDIRTSSGHDEASPASGRKPKSPHSIRTSVMNVREQLVCDDEPSSSSHAPPGCSADGASLMCSGEAGPSRPSISVREELERFSAALAQPILVPQSCEEACPPAALTNEAPPPPQSRPEKTVLLDSSMELTVCSDGDIVTVDTTARRRQQKTLDQTRTSSGSEPVPSHTENPESSAPNARFMRAAPSRIPKLKLLEQRPLPKADQDLDDYFKDLERTRITCRKSRSRPRKNLASSSDPDVPGPEDRPQTTRAETSSSGRVKSRCRSTFVVALISSSDEVHLDGSPSEEPPSEEPPSEEPPSEEPPSEEPPSEEPPSEEPPSEEPPSEEPPSEEPPSEEPPSEEPPSEEPPSEEPPNARTDARSSGKRSWEASEEQSVTPDLQVEVLTQDPAPRLKSHKQKRSRREEPGRSTRKTKEKKGLTKASDLDSSSHPDTNNTCGAPPPPEEKQDTPPESDVGHAFNPPLRSRNRRETFDFCQVPPDQSEKQGRVLTNTLPTPEGEPGGRSRRHHAAVSYKEPNMRSKMRGDVFKESKKKKKSQKKGAGLPAASTYL